MKRKNNPQRFKFQTVKVLLDNFKSEIIIPNINIEEINEVEVYDEVHDNTCGDDDDSIE